MLRESARTRRELWLTKVKVDAAASQVAAENKVAVNRAAAVKKVEVKRPAAVVVQVVAVAVVVPRGAAAAIAKLRTEKGEFPKDSPLSLELLPRRVLQRSYAPQCLPSSPTT